MIITSQNLATLNRGFRTLFLDAYQGAGYTPRVDEYAMATSSTSAEEFYGFLAAVPGLKELLGEVVIRNIADLNFSVKNREFESTIGVKRKDIERDNFGMYNMLFQAMGIAAKEHPDELLFTLLANAFTTTCYTGKNFFDTNHEPIKGKQKFSNIGTKKLSAANFTTGRTNIKSRLNTEGRPMNLGRQLVLVVSPQNEDLGKQILQADFVQQTAQNVAKTENVGVAAVSNTLKNAARLDVVPFLAANPDMWFVLELGYPIKPFINQTEVATEFVSLNNPNEEHVLLKKEFLHQAYRRGNVGLALPELAYGSTGVDPA